MTQAGGPVMFGPDKEHYDCFLFLLDVDHDPYATPAVRSYAVSIREVNPELSQSILLRLNGAPSSERLRAIDGKE
jgi:hypothetical protein